MQFITRPLQNWTRPATGSRTRGDYAAGYQKTLDELDRELRRLDVKGDVVIQIDLDEQAIRRDGLPYANRNPRTPRVAVAFTGKHGAMIYRCDVHHDWRDNLRAICLGLQRLRLVDQSGITSRGEQYTGFRALPPGGIPMGPPPLTIEEAAREIATLMSVPEVEDWRLMMTDVHAFKSIYRAAVLRYHADAAGGAARPEWHRLQAAADVLKKHHNLA